jgi:uncharacterized protein
MTSIVRQSTSSTNSAVSTAIVGAAVCLSLHSIAVFAADMDVRHLQARAERGSVKQQIELGAAYFVGRGVLRDERLAAYWYEKAANAGDPVAQKQIGYFYQVGIGVPRDPVRAVQWYERAVAGGLISAKVNLGVAYVWGTGVPKDEALGARLFKDAVGKGSGLGACYLGDMYYYGVGVTQDKETAEHWYTTGAKLHDPRAEFRLASFLSVEQNHEHDLKRAAELLRKSSGAGFVPAKHALGLLLARNPDMAASPQEMISLLEDAAEAGTWRSSVVLGVLARDGEGMPADKRAAYFHFRVATLQGGQAASHLLANDLRILSAELGTAQTKASDSEAAAWFDEHQLSLEFVYKDGDNWSDFPAFALADPERDVHAGRLIPVSPY